MTEKIITEEIILNAKSFMPIEQKAGLAREYAKNCVFEVQISVKNGDETNVLPPRYQENPMSKSLYGMMVLLDEYFGLLDRDENGDVTFTSKDFDEWGEAAFMNQLDRFKSSKNIDVRNKVYDILDDYREFYRMLGVEIANYVANKNDILSRLLDYFQASITPDAIKDAISQLTGVATEIKEYEEKPKEWASGEATKAE